jgi:hypothetical protein
MTDQFLQLVVDYPTAATFILPSYLGTRLDFSLIEVSYSFHQEDYIEILDADKNVIGRVKLTN